MNTFQDYMVQLVTKKPKEQRWGQWAMNLLHEMNVILYHDITSVRSKGMPGMGLDIFENDDMSSVQFKNYLNYLMNQSWY